jgi:AcrR family transcriptional regulator
MLNDPPIKGTDQRILAAALRCFLTDGFEGTTLTQIAEAAGVSRQTLYRHYRTRDDVLAGVLSDLAETALVRIRSEVGSMATARERIRHIVEIWCVENYALTRRSPAAEGLSDTAATRARPAMQAGFRRIEQEIAAALGPGPGDTIDLSRQITAMAQGFKQDRPELTEYRARLHRGIETVLLAHAFAPPG